MVFSIPFVVNLFRNVTGSEAIDLTLLTVAVVTCAVGSSMQITHKNLSAKKQHKPLIYKVEVAAIYITGIAFGIIAYFVGERYRETVYTALIGIFGSYMSLDLLKAFKIAFLALIKKLPDAIIQYYLNSKNNGGNTGSDKN